MSENRVIIIQYHGEEVPERILQDFLAAMSVVITQQVNEKPAAVTLLDQDSLINVLTKGVVAHTPVSVEGLRIVSDETTPLHHAVVYISGITEGSRDMNEYLTRLLNQAAAEKRSADSRLHNAIQIIINEWKNNYRRVVSKGINRSKYDVLKTVFNSVY